MTKSSILITLIVESCQLKNDLKQCLNMKLKQEDKDLLNELCKQYHISFDKMVKLIDTVKDYEFKERRTGIYDALTEIIKSDLKMEGK